MTLAARRVRLNKVVCLLSAVDQTSSLDFFKSRPYRVTTFFKTKLIYFPQSKRKEVGLMHPFDCSCRLKIISSVLRTKQRDANTVSC